MTTRKAFYSSAAWWHCRTTFVQSKDYLCERCNRACWTKNDKRYKEAIKQGHDVVFGIVHHKIYLDDVTVNDPYIALNFDNLEYLCITCHNKEHMTKTTEIRKDVTFDEDGNIVRRD